MPPKKAEEAEKSAEMMEKITALERSVEEIKQEMKKKLSILDRLEKRMKEEDQRALETQKIQREEIQKCTSSVKMVAEERHLLAKIPLERNESFTRRVEIPLLDGEQNESWVLWLEQYVELGDFSEVEKLQGVKLLEDFISEPTSYEEDRDSVVEEMRTKQTDVERDELVHQVFDQMSVKGKEKRNLKKKKKRWKKLSTKTQGPVEKYSSSIEKQESSLSCEKIKSGFHDREREEKHQLEEEKWTDVNKYIYTRQMFDKRCTLREKRTRKKSFTKSKRSKYKDTKIHLKIIRFCTEKRSENQRMRLRVCSKGVHYQGLFTRQVFDKKLMPKFTKQENKKTELKYERKCIKHSDYVHRLRYTKLSKTVARKLDKWKKRKQKHNKQKIKNKVSLIPTTELIHLRMSDAQMGEETELLRLLKEKTKPNLKKLKSDVLFCEKQIKQVVIDMLIVTVETAQKKMV